jgi:hypothetical protein
MASLILERAYGSKEQDSKSTVFVVSVEYWRNLIRIARIAIDSRENRATTMLPLIKYFPVCVLDFATSLVMRVCKPTTASNWNV